MEHSVVGFAGFIVMILLLAAVGSRLLGVRLSLRRALLTGFPSLVAGFSVGFLVNRRHPGQITPRVVIASVVATRLLTVLAELLARPGARARAGGLPRPWRALRTMAHSTRSPGSLPGTGWAGSSAGAGPNRARPVSSPAGSGLRLSRPGRSSSSSARLPPPAPTCCPRR